MMSWLIEGLIASTVLMLAVLLLRAPVRRAFGADIGYALWLLPVLRLLLPPLPAAWHETAVAPIAQATETVTVLLIEPVAQSAATPAFSWVGPVLAGLWIAGAAAFVGWHTLAHRRFCRRLLDGTASSERLGGIEVIATDAATGPLAFGVWRRYVAFPRDFAERYEPEERDLALAHELGHHARGDLIANWVALVVLALHWFNPVAWRAFRAFRADQEIANDARVLAGMNPMRRHTYACAILKAAHPTLHPAFLGGTVSATCHLHTIDDLKGRLRMLTTNKTSRTRLLAGAGALALLVTGGLGLTASGTAAAAKMRSSVESATGVDLASLDQAVASPPLPPAPVAAPAEALPPSSARAPVAPAAPDALPAGPNAVRRVMVTHNGKTTIYDHADVDAHLAAHDRVEILPLDPHGSRMLIKNPDDPDGRIEVQDIPAISSANCGIGTGTPTSMVIASGGRHKRKIVICTDRIQKVTADGAAMAANGTNMERNAYVHALDGLRSARARMMASADMDADQRKAALDGIDTAIREIEGDLAKLQ